MTHFLWVEDFNFSEDNRSENIVSSTVSSVFGSILDNIELSTRLAEEDENDAQDFLEEKGIFLKLNLLEALEFINDPKELAKIDFVVLDVDMPLENGQRDNNNYLSSLIERCPPEDDLRKIAGYHIYTELVIELGFPKSHILFCSNHAKYFKTLNKKFENANIKPPVSPHPEKTFLEKNDKEFIAEWLNDARNNYFVLRRGIIEGCYALEASTNDDELKEYFFGLKKYLPLKQPSETEKDSIYLHLARAILHDWDNQGHSIPKGQPNESLGWLLRTARNWLTHDSLLSNIDEKMISFLFLINARLLDANSKVNLDKSKLETFENILLSVFNVTKSTEAERIFNLKCFYTDALNVGQSNGLDFMKKQYFYSQMVNDFHEKKVSNLDYKKLLFRIFMFAIYGQSFSILNNSPRQDYLEYQVKFSKRNKLPLYLTDFEKYFYDLAV